MPKIEESDCACARLLAFTLKAVALSKAQPHLNQRAGFAVAFGLNAHDASLVFHGVGDFLRLVADARQEVLSTPDLDQAVYMEPINEVEELIPRVSLANESKFNNLFNNSSPSEATIRGLRFVAMQVAMLAPKRLPSDKIAELRSLMAELEKLLTDVPDDLVVVLQRCVDVLKSALNHYEIHGNCGLEQAVQSAIGVLITNRQVVLQHKSTLPLAKVWDLISKTSTALSLAKNVKPLIASGVTGLYTMLGPGGDAQAEQPAIHHSVQVDAKPVTNGEVASQ